MIVKNEASVITRAFDSVKHFVDYYCICDTGSSDGTQGIMRQYFKDNNFSGEVYERPWIDFGHNRTENFNLAKGTSDYIMTLDADEVLAPYRDNKPLLTSCVKDLPRLEVDQINIKTSYGSYEYYRPQFFKDGLEWRWEQPLHEYCWSPSKKSEANLDGVCVVPSPDGARSLDPEKFSKDATVLAEHVKKYPKDVRSWFYLAQSHDNAGESEKALEPLDKVLELGGWDEELFEASLRKARIVARLDGMEKAIPIYLEAYHRRPYRAEPLLDILHYYRTKEMFEVALLFGEVAYKLSFPPHDRLFVNRDIYEWRVRDELSICYYFVGRYEEADNLIQEILDNKSARPSSGDLNRIKKNQQLSKDKLNETA